MLVANSVEEKYNSILENTTKDLNAILNRWKDSRKIITYTDINSVFKSIFSRYCKHYFDYKFWNRLVRYSNPTPTILDNKLVHIHISSIYEGTNSFKECIDNFDFKNEKYSIGDVIATPNFVGVNPSNIINYHSIKEIKFN